MKIVEDTLGGQGAWSALQSSGEAEPCYYGFPPWLQFWVAAAFRETCLEASVIEYTWMSGVDVWEKGDAHVLWQNFLISYSVSLITAEIASLIRQ